MLGGDLDRVEKVIKLFGIVSSKQGFKQQHLVLNGCSDVMMAVFEDRGYHARSAIGTNTLPLDAAVEVDFGQNQGALHSLGCHPRHLRVVASGYRIGLNRLAVQGSH